MATINFSLPYFGNFEVRTTADVYRYVEQAQKHSVEKKTDQFSRLQTTAYLLMSFAMSFFEAFPKGLKAIGEGSIYSLLGENETAKDTFFKNGKLALQNLGFAVYQLFLTLDALAFPSEVNERLTLQKPIMPVPGLISNDVNDITNQLIFKNEALRKQVAFLQRQLISNSEERGIIEGFLTMNEGYEVRIGEIRLKADQDVEYAEAKAVKYQEIVEEKEKQLEEQKQRFESQVKELHKQHETDERFWQYITEHLERDWKEKSGKDLLAKLEHVRISPQTVVNYFKYQSQHNNGD